MQIAADTAAVMVTHDGERFLRQQCESIFRGDLLPAVLIVVDDASRDRSRDILRDLARSAPIPVEIILADGSNVSNLKSRITRNVTMGLAAAASYEIVLLSDQDDEWLVNRLACQREVLRNDASAMLVAGDGILIDEAGQEIGGRLSDSFPRPPNWTTLDAAGRARAALRTPFVTGAAAALSMSLVRAMQPVPDRWLYDRWSTLVAVASNGLVLQSEPVIRYRIHEGQVLGKRQAQTGVGGRRWLQVLQRGAGPIESAARVAQVVRRLKPIATDPGVRRELSLAAVIGSALDRS
jgi:glycosyltransferase involved in cell wall biosynthesis